MNKSEMNYKKELKENGVFKFWDNYYKSDPIKRKELLKPIIKRFRELAKIKDISKDRFDDLYYYALISYFDDLGEYFLMKDLFNSGEIK